MDALELTTALHTCRDRGPMVHFVRRTYMEARQKGDLHLAETKVSSHSATVQQTLDICTSTTMILNPEISHERIQQKSLQDPA
jgi:hypothetical protein